MKRTHILPFLILCFLVLPAAQCTPDQVLVKGVRGYTDVVLPEYLDMVNKAYRKLPDGTFEPWFKDPDSRAIRHETAEGIERLLKVAEDR